MIDLFRGLKNLLKVNRLYNDGSMFRLHYSATVAILLVSSLVVTARQYVGTPIECLHNKEMTTSFINTFCWIHSTYTVPGSKEKDLPYPGIDRDRLTDPSARKYQKYYQWVPFILCFQALLFYFPRWLWKQWEGGKIQSLVTELGIGTTVQNDSSKLRCTVLVEYLRASKGKHNLWAARYFICELLSLVNIVGQLFLMDRFFDGEFLEYGIKVMSIIDLDPEDRHDPMILLFPRVTKCQFKKFGSSGEIENHDAICILPLNVINEKIYVFLWFWMAILTVLTVGVLISRLVIIVFGWPRVYMLNSKLRFTAKMEVNKVVSSTGFGDWFLLYMLARNVDPLVSHEVLVELSNLTANDSIDTMPAATSDLPRWLWKQWEGGKIQSLAMDFGVGTGVPSDKELNSRREMLVEYLWESRGQHNWWAARYILCELLSLVNVVGQLFLMDRFFDGEFLLYGIRVVALTEMDPEDRQDPMILLFPLNVANEKIYVFLWFWMVILAGLTAVVIVFRILIFVSAWLRVYLLYVRLRFSARDELNNVVHECQFGDWFLIYMLAQNIDPLVCKEVVISISKRVSTKSPKPQTA